MKTTRLYTAFILAAGLAFFFATLARAADDNTSTIKFSDPSKPGTVKISAGHGEINVQGADTTEVTVKSDSKASTAKPRKDGLRVISSASSFGLNEKDNVIVVDGGMNNWGRGGGGNFRLTVPRNTRVIVESSFGGGSITCAGLTGDIEIKSMQGEIKLDDVSGGVMVETMNGEIKANIRELHDDKPLSFTTMNGEVKISVPPSAKANVRFRTQNGVVLTDFEENALTTKTENSTTSTSRGKWSYASGGKSNKVISVEIEDTIREAARVGATAVSEAIIAVKEGLEASRIDNDEARKEVEAARKDLERARRESERSQRDAERRTVRNPSDESVPPTPPVVAVSPVAPKPAPMPKVPTVATITGGKLVTGTLNGGGPEISVSTMNGDVILRKLEAK